MNTKTCHVCGFPESMVTLVPFLTDIGDDWASTPKLKLSKPECKVEMHICMCCIRDIKKIPFSELPEGAKS